MKMSTCQEFSSDCFNYLYTVAHSKYSKHFGSLKSGLCNCCWIFTSKNFKTKQFYFSSLLSECEGYSYCYIPTSCCFIKLCLTHCLLRQDPDMQNDPKCSSRRRQSQLSFCYSKVYNKVPRMVFKSFRASGKRDKIEWWMRAFCNELYLYHTSTFTIQSCSSSIFLLHMSKNTL